jgi:acetyltransferase
VPDYDAFLEVAQLMAHTPKPAKLGLGVVSHSGGISSLTADMCGYAGLDLPPLSQGALDRINDVLKGFGWAANPADVTGFANSDAFPEIMQAMINEPEVGTLVVASAGADRQAEQVIELRDQSDKGIAFLWTGSRSATAGLDKLKAARIPVFYLPASLASGLKQRWDYHTWREQRLTHEFATAPDPTAAQRQTVERLQGLGRRTLSESESKALIAAWDVPVSREARATSADDAVTAAERIGYPVALKVESPDILHKPEAGVIRLGLQDKDQVRAAYEAVMANATRYAPEAAISGVLVQEMVSGGVEVIVGIAYDDQLGPMLLFGTGGVLVEVYQDVALRCCPITRTEALEMVSEVKGARLLQGFRGQTPMDVEVLADVLVNVSHLAVNLDGSLAELDINPLLVLPVGLGVKAVDALAIFK